MESRFKTQWNYDPKKSRGEKGGGISKTVPDQNLTVREILIRHTRGIPTDNAKTPIYLGDTDLPDMERMELTDKMELIRSAAMTRQQIESQLSEEEKATKDQEKKEFEEMKKKLEELEKQQKQPNEA